MDKPEPGSVRIYGASDDLIEVEGDLSEEWGVYSQNSVLRYLGFSDGTLLQVTYGAHGQGEWRIALMQQGTATYHHVPAYSEGSDSYSDVVTLTGDLRWVTCGEQCKLRRKA